MTKELRSMAVLVGLGVALLVSGCAGENAPCNTDPSQIEAARSDLSAAEQMVESGKAELAQAEKDLAALEKDMDGLADPSELEAHLHKLKKGSGR